MTDFNPARVQTLIDTAKALLAHLADIKKATHSYDTRETYLHDLARLTVNMRGALGDLVDAVPESSAAENAHDGIDLKHESYGVITASRVSGGIKLFGTVQDTHTTCVALRITRARASMRDGDATLCVHEDYGNGDRSIVEVYLSTAQWAELLSSLGAGTGVPCTLRSVRGRNMAKVPEAYQDNPDRVIEAFKKKLRERPKYSSTVFSDFVETVRASKLSKKDQDKLTGMARDLMSGGIADAEWTLEEFSSHAAKLRAAHMVELDATITGVVQKLGLERLREVLTEQHVPAIAAAIDITETE